MNEEKELPPEGVPQPVFGITPQQPTRIVEGNRAALGLPPQTAPTPGQTAYEAYCRHVDRISPPPWEHLHSGYQDGWEQVAEAGRAALAAQERPASASASQARRREEQAAPELAAAMREARGYREGIAGLLDELKTSAAATHPSKKSQIESAVIRKLQKILDGK